MTSGEKKKSALKSETETWKRQSLKRARNAKRFLRSKYTEYFFEVWVDNTNTVLFDLEVSRLILSGRSDLSSVSREHLTYITYPFKLINYPSYINLLKKLGDFLN